MKFNFKLLKNEYIDDISSEGFIYEHISGAKLVYIENDDNNRVFSATFKTLPENNKGIAHIMEHSVLCGSRRYPVKDPFNELSKGSLNTYLNAMTFSDKTMYPVASTNEKDFINLMNVYLDAVFFPLIYERKGIFLQEGHHKEKEKINGVVYNEMKGVFSSPDRIIDFKTTEKLFEDTKYKFYSGGVPEFIPELTYEEFLEFHKKYYHPANCILYLYGDIDIDKYLEFIDRDYLSEFDFKEIKMEYMLQKKYEEIKTTEFNYEVYDNQCEENKNYFECGAIIGDALDFKLSFAFEILTDILLETESSPLKKAFIKNGIGDNVCGGFDDGMFQTAFFVSVEKTEFNDLKKFKKVYFDTLNEIVENGLDRRLVESCINKYRFYFKEEDFGYKPKGLFYNILMIKSFVYNNGNFDGIKFNELFEYVDKLNFEEVIKKYLIENKSYVFAVMKPVGKKNSETVFYEDDAEFDNYKKITDTEGDIKKIPVLKIEDIDKLAKNIEISEDFIGGVKLISSLIENDDIIYVNMLFDTRTLDAEELKYISVLKYIFGKLDTKSYSYEQVSNEINFYFGDFNADFETYGNDNDFLPVLSINMKFLRKNIDNVFSIAEEVIFSSVFDKKRIKELLLEFCLLLEKSFVKNGHIYAVSRCMSYLSECDRYSQYVEGLEFYRFLKGLLNDFDSKADIVVNRLKVVSHKIFNKNAMTFGLVCDEGNYKNVYGKLQNICGKFNNSDFIRKNIRLINDCENEAFIIGSEVQYNVMAADYKKFGVKYEGKMLAIEKIIQSDYLWNKIRVEGGAYGSGFSFLRRGLFYLYSYRDPNVLKTFDAYKNIPDYLKNIRLSDREMRKYIIGTINVLDRPIKISQIMNKILKRKLSKISDEQRQAEREAVLSIKQSDISEFSDIFEKCLTKSHICSFGNEYALKNEGVYFNSIKNL